LAEIGDGAFHQGQPIWVIQEGGSQRPAKYAGEGELSAWFGGASTVMVIYEDTGESAGAETDRIIPREP
jgi:hypothetical protein